MTSAPPAPLRTPPPVYTAGLLAPLHAELMALLRALAPADWERPTVAGRWRVRDVAAHLLDGGLRRLSFHRDGHRPPGGPGEGFVALVHFIDRLNADWIEVARRLSPRVLVDLLASTGPALDEFLASLPPHEPAFFPVAWAGEGASEHWMDVGREYTERWHHQAQIRDAVGAPPLAGQRWLAPVIALSVRALPRALARVRAADGAAVVVRVTGEGGGAWSLVRQRGAWALGEGAAPAPAATVTVADDDAWRLLFNALTPEEAARRAVLEGDPTLGAAVLRGRAVMVADPP
ncbi:MAG TPA: maleylpyruvate isomerase N-terminal domain-containing protein [Gemmatimonadaceae bacterium]|nr:maleylpyruvate isomerase N-terminal domain-containing protein [Gemmatimonadaceae bacterium]